MIVMLVSYQGKRSQNIAILSEEGQQKLMLAVSAVEAVGDELKSGNIQVCFLQLLRKNFDHFLEVKKVML